jgi:4-aminobutyrate aminotransferase/(S)-3-amino-2-methylpropionate transaminase
VTAQGATITDLDGRELIDFAAGIGVMNVGHCPEPIVRAIQNQAARLMHTCFNVAMYDGYIELAEKLVELLPHGEETKVMLTNSGAEAVENAIKIARQATGKAGILCFTGAFHGRSMMAMSLTAKVGNKLGCGPFAGELYRLDFPNYYRFGKGMTENEYIDQEIQKLNDFFVTHADAGNMAAAIIEVVQGEGGFNVVPRRYLQALRDVCDAKGMLLILDEVQTGFGRTGE